MIASLFAVGWYLCVIALAVAAVVLGLSRRRGAGQLDLTESYELGRWDDHSRHARREREEELAELRRKRR